MEYLSDVTDLTKWLGTLFGIWLLCLSLSLGVGVGLTGLYGVQYCQQRMVIGRKKTWMGETEDISMDDTIDEFISTLWLDAFFDDATEAQYLLLPNNFCRRSSYKIYIRYR